MEHAKVREGMRVLFEGREWTVKTVSQKRKAIYLEGKRGAISPTAVAPVKK